MNSQASMTQVELKDHLMDPKQALYLNLDSLGETGLIWFCIYSPNYVFFVFYMLFRFFDNMCWNTHLVTTLTLGEGSYQLFHVGMLFPVHFPHF